MSGRHDPTVGEVQALAPFSPWTKAAYFVGGNLLPSLGLLLAISGVAEKPEWQTNQFHDFASFLMAGPAAAVFSPFLIYSIACTTLAIFRPRAAMQSFLLRLGLYSGIALGLHYCIVVGVLILRISDLTSRKNIAMAAVVVPLACIAIVFVAWSIWWLGGAMKRVIRRFSQFRLWLLFVMFAAPVTALALGTAFGKDAVFWVLFAMLSPSLLGIVLAPCWFLAATAAMSVRIVRLRAARFQFNLLHLLAVISWIGAYLSAWRFAVYNALEAYSALPTTPPSSNCYIATAAAGGHRSVVRWREVRGVAGEVFRANRQLAYLKCGEIALQTAAPRLHRGLRRIYDRWGPTLARRLRNRLAADAAYLALKPAEWATRLALVTIAPNAIPLARKLYGGV